MDKMTPSPMPHMPEDTGSSPVKRQKSVLQLHIENIWFLFIKELRGVLFGDPLLLLLILYTFTLSIYSVATGASTDIKDLVIGFVDEDRSQLSGRIIDSMTPPLFKETRLIAAKDIDPLMDKGDLIFIVEIPPSFEQKVLSGQQTEIQIDVDATAMIQAGNGAGYIQSILTSVLQDYAAERGARLPAPSFDVKVHAEYNQNLTSYWFSSVMQIVNNITMLIIVLTGAALIREREQGTVEHLLVMPLVPTEIMLSKVIANSLVILVAAAISLSFVVELWLGVPINGSILLFFVGAALFSMATAALGIMLGTIASTMGQFGLLMMPVMTLLMLLSGGTTPMESMPEWLQWVMQIGTPTPHFVAFSQAVLFRGAGITIVYPELLALAAIGIVYFMVALKRFKRVIFGI